MEVRSRSLNEKFFRRAKHSYGKVFILEEEDPEIKKVFLTRKIYVMLSIEAKRSFENRKI